MKNSCPNSGIVFSIPFPELRGLCSMYAKHSGLLSGTRGTRDCRLEVPHGSLPMFGSAACCLPWRGWVRHAPWFRAGPKEPSILRIVHPGERSPKGIMHSVPQESGFRTRRDWASLVGLLCHVASIGFRVWLTWGHVLCLLWNGCTTLDLLSPYLCPSLTHLQNRQDSCICLTVSYEDKDVLSLHLRE